MKVLPVFLLTALLIITVQVYAARVDYPVDPLEYNVYSSVLDDWLGQQPDKQVLVKPYTKIETKLRALDKEIKYLDDNLNGLSSETIIDFTAKNTQSYPIDDFFSQRANVKVLNEQELDQTFSFIDGWEKFKDTHNDVFGIITLSRVGFNQQRTQALVYISNQWADFQGAGSYYLLNRNPGACWQIIDKLKVWYSWDQIE